MPIHWSFSVSDKDRALEKFRQLIDEGTTDQSQLRAAELLGKSVGLFKDVQVQEEQRSSAEIWAELKERLESLSGDQGGKLDIDPADDDSIH